MTNQGSCPCGAVRFAISGPVRDVIVCHCTACREATGGPWPASAASRGRCRSCGTVVFWDAPGRETVSFAAALLDGGARLDVAAHIWVPEAERSALAAAGVPVESRGLPASVTLGWQDEARTTG